ncbi:hypothetical protein BDK51DRAFT_33833 [Blyttiomyces helicus]|uniref:Uncharacterized protein n=1 Tax=Blyttiomyces helicus TaxID=388810 RepID=A0A4P9WN64_9FUNG|nr:hypothetical protein BDK51DRAFT_33833 [Blyttiomyces helicus]|eukprot:RKO94551.1 hypothetical protein BDK51DRAFT_33833 [Blyttiomyces helicus]
MSSDSMDINRTSVKDPTINLKTNSKDPTPRPERGAAPYGYVAGCQEIKTCLDTILSNSPLNRARKEIYDPDLHILEETGWSPQLSPSKYPNNSVLRLDGLPQRDCSSLSSSYLAPPALCKGHWGCRIAREETQTFQSLELSRRGAAMGQKRGSGPVDKKDEAVEIRLAWPPPLAGKGLGVMGEETGPGRRLQGSFAGDTAMVNNIFKVNNAEGMVHAEIDACSALKQL